jgi:hypothetical protein
MWAKENPTQASRIHFDFTNRMSIFDPTANTAFDSAMAQRNRVQDLIESSNKLGIPSAFQFPGTTVTPARDRQDFTPYFKGIQRRYQGYQDGDHQIIFR